MASRFEFAPFWIQKERLTGLITPCIGTAFYNIIVKETQKWLEDKEEDISNYWMIASKCKDIGNWKHQITLCGELTVEEAMDLSQDWLQNQMNTKEKQ